MRTLYYIIFHFNCYYYKLQIGYINCDKKNCVTRKQNWIQRNYLNPMIFNVLVRGTTTRVVLRKFECSRTDAEETPISSLAIVNVAELLNTWVISARGNLFIFLLPFFLKDWTLGGIEIEFFLVFFISTLVQIEGIDVLFVALICHCWIRLSITRWGFSERKRNNVAGGVDYVMKWGI